MNSGGRNHFELFSLAESFDLDRHQLERAYKELQGHYHPDRFVQAGERERRLALQYTSLINDAYETLSSPLKRAAYLLSLHGVDPDSVDQARLGSDFLFKQLELREELEEIRRSASLEELDKLKEDVERDIEAYFVRFRELLAQADYEAARPLYNRLQFTCKLRDEIDQTEEKLLDY